MFELIFLGTSASAPSVRRNLPAQLVKHDEHRFLIDCGEGTQRQILSAGLGFKRLNKILITHSHLDHILGIAGLLSTFLRWEMMEELEIFGGQTALERIHNLLYGVVLRGASSNIPLFFRPVSEGIFFQTEDFSVSAFPVNHRGPDCLGFLFEEKGHCPFLPDKAEELNIPPGPWRRDLVNGHPASLPDGRIIQPEMVLGEYKAGTRMVFTGDLGKVDNHVIETCSNADALICESTYLQEEAEMAIEFGHFTAKQAAELALQCGVRQLILTHISRRYREKDVLQEAQTIFPNTVVARDFDVFQIKHD